MSERRVGLLLADLAEPRHEPAAGGDVEHEPAEEGQQQPDVERAATPSIVPT
jgi:hypothetical protein